MVQSLQEGEPLRLLTNKSVQPLRGNTIWFVVGEGETPKRYSLGSVFVASDVGETADDGFTHYATGPGHVFQPAIPLNGFDWFPEFFRSLARFSLGVVEMKVPRFIEALQALAPEFGE